MKAPISIRPGNPIDPIRPIYPIKPVDFIRPGNPVDFIRPIDPIRPIRSRTTTLSVIDENFQPISATINSNQSLRGLGASAVPTGGKTIATALLPEKFTISTGPIF